MTLRRGLLEAASLTECQIKNKGVAMMNKIELQVNNGRTMQLVQDKYDGDITLNVFDNTHVFDYTETIPPGDMVMLINYYRCQKALGEPIF